MIGYAVFITKYLGFENLEYDKFSLFLADTLLEIDKHEWGALRDRATEMLLGHLLSMAADDKGVIALNSFEVDDRGYKVSYKDSPGAFNTWFGQEYERILSELGKSQISVNAPQKTTFIGFREDKSGICW